MSNERLPDNPLNIAPKREGYITSSWDGLTRPRFVERKPDRPLPLSEDPARRFRDKPVEDWTPTECRVLLATIDQLRADLTAARSEISLARQLAIGVEPDELALQFGGMGLENLPLAVAVADLRKRLEEYDQ